VSTKSNPQPILSEKAAALLGHLVTLADSKGEVAVTRKKLAMALGASVPTVSRALRELKEAGLLAVMAEGGGRGQPTRYRITALAREPVPANRGIGDSCYPSAGASTGKSTGKRYHGDPVHEPDHDLEGVRSCGVELGQAMAMGAFGLLEGAWRAWRGVPMWGRIALAGGSLGTVGALVGRSYGGRIGTFIGGASGALAGGLLAALVPSESEALSQQPTASCSNSPLEPAAMDDFIWAIVDKAANQ